MKGRTELGRGTLASAPQPPARGLRPAPDPGPTATAQSARQPKCLPKAGSHAPCRTAVKTQESPPHQACDSSCGSRELVGKIQGRGASQWLCKCACARLPPRPHPRPPGLAVQRAPGVYVCSPQERRGGDSELALDWTATRDEAGRRPMIGPRQLDPEFEARKPRSAGPEEELSIRKGWVHCESPST